METVSAESKTDFESHRSIDHCTPAKAPADSGEPVTGEACAAAASKVPPAPSRGEGPVTLAELVRGIAAELNGRPHVPLEKRSVIQDLMARYDPSSGDWKRFEMYDKFKYTRNLVATDHKTFTLLLLCWNKAQTSPIHDHPCDGCWMRVVKGAVQETQFQRDESTETLVQVDSRVAHEGQVAFIHDSIALHKVANPSSEETACTLHLYAPPFRRCKLWTDPSDATKVMEPVITHYSENGRKVEYC
mmetsp:Transcript_4516/g.14578  ORF Transcript_4516/g.14578 Transcript_4516/m.14578 type:complete len:245 (-) Transcript_4516:129-863(-)|eukprot:CAMPEP_0196781608 /NCGR_PEP_ID=MMETSP1104-20130614/9943_1 /TAXON_ID=33652 /ORGANISM="Cafeteria sp., Strain Caron Lab Isolate" /LENGTH=244 /DNA_ID=CAMNT_0042151841 /DNA_START=41 /DNA_END=775 /DNA_ORIENTATION=-